MRPAKFHTFLQIGRSVCETLIYKRVSVTTMLERHDYQQAVQAHRDKALVILSGDLEHFGQRWKLLNTRFEGVLRDEEG